MKKIIAFIIILTAAGSLYAQDSWNITTGINATPGLIYNGSWDPAYNGNAMTIIISRQSGMLLLEAGLEAGYNYTGINLLFPVKAGLELAGSDSLKLAALGSIMPGMIMSRPVPFFLFAAEIAGRLTWDVNPGFSLALTAGPRYTLSPGYTTAVAPLEMIDITIGLAAGFRI